MIYIVRSHASMNKQKKIRPQKIMFQRRIQSEELSVVHAEYMLYVCKVQVSNYVLRYMYKHVLYSNSSTSSLDVSTPSHIPARRVPSPRPRFPHHRRARGGVLDSALCRHGVPFHGSTQLCMYVRPSSRGGGFSPAAAVGSVGPPPPPPPPAGRVGARTGVVGAGILTPCLSPPPPRYNTYPASTYVGSVLVPASCVCEGSVGWTVGSWVRAGRGGGGCDLRLDTEEKAANGAGGKGLDCGRYRHLCRCSMPYVPSTSTAMAGSRGGGWARLSVTEGYVLGAPGVVADRGAALAEGTVRPTSAFPGS